MLLITRAEDEHYKTYPSGITLFYPDSERKVTPVGYVHHHAVSEEFGDDLTGRVVVFTKWSDREFTLVGKTFCVIDERDVLAFWE